MNTTNHFTALLVSLMCFILSAMPVWAEEGAWPNVSPGKYVGYAEIYLVKNGSYTIEGHTNLGDRCELTVSKEGVEYDGNLFRWDHPGLQASRAAGTGTERINFRGKIGNVVVVDLDLGSVNGAASRVMRMSVATAP